MPLKEPVWIAEFAPGTDLSRAARELAAVIGIAESEIGVAEKWLGFPEIDWPQRQKILASPGFLRVYTVQCPYDS